MSPAGRGARQAQAKSGARQEPVESSITIDHTGISAFSPHLIAHRREQSHDAPFLFLYISVAVGHIILYSTFMLHMFVLRLPFFIFIYCLELLDERLEEESCAFAVGYQALPFSHVDHRVWTDLYIAYGTHTAGKQKLSERRGWTTVGVLGWIS